MFLCSDVKNDDDNRNDGIQLPLLPVARVMFLSSTFKVYVGFKANCH